MIPRKLKTCLGCGKPKLLYAHGYCTSCYPKYITKKKISTGVKAKENKRKDPRLSESYAFEKAYYMWNGKNFITGERIPKDEVCFANCAHVINKGGHEWFRYYSLNIVLLSHEQHTLYDNVTIEQLDKRIEQHPDENWQKLFNYAYELLAEYEDWVSEHYKEYKL